MIETAVLRKGQELGVIAVDELADKVTYRLGVERQYKWSDPEEQVRAEFILTLIFHYDYSPQRIATELSIPGRTPTNWADIVVFRDDRRRDPYITIEVGAPAASPAERSQKIEQLFGYANALDSEFAVYYDTVDVKQCWQVRGQGGLERTRNLVGDIPRNYGEIPEYTYVHQEGRDLSSVPSHVLSHIFKQCHNDLWSGGRLGPTEAFDEMSKLIFAKLYDELRTPNGKPYQFQWGTYETDIIAANRVIACYEAARDSDTGVFTEDIRSEPHKIASVVKRLQHVSLDRTDPDAKGRAFEQFLGEVFRGNLGQYFTRRELVDFLVGMAQPALDDLILDPACGSGGFLVHSMRSVFQQIEDSYRGNNHTIFRLKEDFAKNHIYGIEINERIARVAMMDMVVNEDGHTNIEVGSGLDKAFTNPSIKDGYFSLILTNPPFGDTVKREERDKLGQSDLEDYELSRGKRTAKSEVLFIERCTRFLREGGRFGMVVPDGVLSNPSAQHVREYLMRNFQIQAVVALPSFAFRKSGSGIRTSLVLARKWKTGEYRQQDYPIFMAIADHIGYDATARPDSNDLPLLLRHYQRGAGSLDDQVIRVQRSQIANSQRLNPLFYYLGVIIEQTFQSIAYPIHTLHEIAGETIQSGKSPRGGAQYSIGDIPIILIGNISADGTLNMKDANFVDEDFFNKNYERAAIKAFDILVAKDGATTGKTGLVPNDFEYDKCLVNEHIFKLTVGSSLPGDLEVRDEDESAERKQLNTLYVFFFLKSQLGQQQIRREISGGAQGGITKEFMKNIRVPIPPLNDRKQFVARCQREYQEYLSLAAKSQDQLARFNDSLRML